MSAKRSIEITDRHGNTLTVETDGTDMLVEVQREGEAVELDETDRQRLRDFLAVNS